MLNFKSSTIRFRTPSMNQAGDTIVEVLIAISIVSLILTAAYVISNRNVVAIQENQERLQAQQLVEGQIEYLHNQPLTAGHTCYAANGTQTSGTGCQRTGVQGSGAQYSISITGPVASAYTIKTTWQGINDVQTNAVTMYYRVN